MTIDRALIEMDPWSEGPPEKLLGLMPAAFWKEHRAVPVERRDGALVIAAAGVLPAETISQVRRTTFHDVRPVAAAEDEIDLWLAVTSGERSWEEALAASVISLIRGIGFGARPGELPAMPTRDTDVETIARAFELAEDAAVEVLALRARLPQIRLGRYPRPPYLAAVLESATAKELRVAPVAVHRGIAVLATPRVPGPAARAAARRDRPRPADRALRADDLRHGIRADVPEGRDGPGRAHGGGRLRAPAADGRGADDAPRRARPDLPPQRGEPPPGGAAPRIRAAGAGRRGDRPPRRPSARSRRRADRSRPRCRRARGPGPLARAPVRPAREGGPRAARRHRSAPRRRRGRGHPPRHRQR